MEHHAGLDVSLKETSVCIVDGAGKIIRETRVASEPEALVGYFSSLEIKVVRIGLEAGPLSQWLYAALTQAGFAVVTDHRAEVLGFHDPVDGDDRQALGLQLAIAVVTGRQATGDDQRIATARLEQLQQLALAVRRIVGARNQ